MKVYPDGVTGGIPPSNVKRNLPSQNHSNGWSKGASRRNKTFLYSVDTGRLDGIGYAFTLTLKECPPTSKEFHRILKNFTVCLRRSGFTRMHWVIEWQRRGVPHIHGIAYFKTPPKTCLITHWLRVSKAYGSQACSQCVLVINDPVGWKKYLAKHGARGVDHYQRSNLNKPKPWDKSGRIWGHLGNWPTQEIELEIDSKSFYTFRRLARSWRKSNARKERNRSRIKSARRMLKCNERSLASVRGISEWIPREITLSMLQHIEKRYPDSEITN